MTIYDVDVRAVYWAAVHGGAGWPVEPAELGAMVRDGEVAVYEAASGGYIAVADVDGPWAVRL